MESALVRQPRVSSAPPRAGRALRIALGVAGTALAASAVLLQPFAATHLFPGRRVASPAAPAPVPPADFRAALGDLPTVGKSASAPPRLPPAPAAADRAEPHPAAPNNVPAGGSPAQPAVAVVSSPPAAEPPGQAAAPPAAATGESSPAPAPALTIPVASASGPAATRFGAPPPPREPLPLETDLIGPDSPGADASARPHPIPPRGIAPDNKPVAAGRHG